MYNIKIFIKFLISKYKSYYCTDICTDKNTEDLRCVTATFLEKLCEYMDGSIFFITNVVL